MQSTEAPVDVSVSPLEVETSATPELEVSLLVPLEDVDSASPLDEEVEVDTPDVEGSVVEPVLLASVSSPLTSSPQAGRRNSAMGRQERLGRMVRGYRGGYPRTVKILARCQDRVIVLVGPYSVAEVQLGPEVRDEARLLVGVPQLGEVVRLEERADALKVFTCDGCSNYGPRGIPKGGGVAFQQFGLCHGSYPWGREPGWYCMSCSMPPR